MIAKIIMREDRGRILKWELPRFDHLKIDDGSGSPWVYEFFVERDLELEGKIEEFNEEFNHHRPWGFAIMTSAHDQVIWNINPPADQQHLAV